MVTKHRLGRIYCHLPAVKELYIKRWKEKSLDEQEERDAKRFLEVEKKIHLEMFPNNEELFEDGADEGEEGEEGEGTEAVAEVNKKIKRKRGGKAKKVVESVDEYDGAELA